TTIARRWFEPTTPTPMVFSGVNPEDDYTIHAEGDGVSSKSQTVSLSDHKWPRQLDLKIEIRNSISGEFDGPKPVTPRLAKAAK
ncbi:MAG: hypothetical protein WBQ89_26325, partial [Candidatus Acidiferrum sp.]